MCFAEVNQSSPRLQRKWSGCGSKRSYEPWLWRDKTATKLLSSYVCNVFMHLHERGVAAAAVQCLESETFELEGSSSAQQRHLRSVIFSQTWLEMQIGKAEKTLHVCSGALPGRIKRSFTNQLWSPAAKLFLATTPSIDLLAGRQCRGVCQIGACTTTSPNKLRKGAFLGGRMLTVETICAYAELNEPPELK